MSEMTGYGTARRAAALTWVLSVVLAVPTAVLLAVGPDETRSSDIFAGFGGLSFLALALTYATVGAIVVARVPHNRIGWIFCLTGIATIAQLISWQYADVGLNSSHDLPGASAAAVFNNVIGESTAGLLALSLLLFPDGRLPSRRWWPALASLLAGIALLVAAGTLTPGPYDQPFSTVTNPAGIPGARGAMDAVNLAGWLLVLAGIVAGAAAMVIRLRRARGVERQQLKLVLAVGAVVATASALLMSTWLVWPTGDLQLRIAILGGCFAAFPIAAGIAILRYRLYDVDFVLNRSLVYGVVTVVLAGAFAVTTLVLGTALGRGSAWATAGATLVVAVAFRPVRTRVQDAVDRRFNRARYDALQRMADFLEALRAGRAAPEEVERLLRELIADPRVKLLFFLPESELYVDVRGVPVARDADDGRDRIPIERLGQPVGVVLYGAATQQQTDLLRHVVEAGGLAIEIARLRVELRRQLAEVEASRARIVTAANEERRRIERDLHDGAQQRLVSIGLALRHAQHELSGSKPARASETLDSAVAEVAVAIDELRELARGLPPAQLDSGLAPAFRELARLAPIPVSVNAPSERFDRGVEAAAYFVGCEGLTNAVKHANATRIALTAARQNGRLVVSIADDGVGGATPMEGSGLRGLSDRVAALGGTLRIESGRGKGTTLVAELPCGS
jgi:signal transduction histidine kinase